MILFRKRTKIVSQEKQKNDGPDKVRWRFKGVFGLRWRAEAPKTATAIEELRISKPPQLELDLPIISSIEPTKKPTLRACETELLAAAAFITPTNALEISYAIKSALERRLTPLFNAYQIAKLLPSSSIPRAVVIDVRNMRSVSVDPVAKTLTCSAGSNVKDCDLAAAEYGLAVVGGTWSNLRMGGVALGGGYGWLSGEYGLVTDNLLSATVVLAGGTIVTVSETENEDLFWGIRGSYTNLGICADFTFRCHEIKHDVVFGSLIFGFEMLKEVLEAVMAIRTGKHDVRDIADEKWNENIQDGKTAFSVRVEFERPTCDAFSAQILVLLFHNGALKDAEEIFAPILNITSTSAGTSSTRPSSPTSTLSRASNTGCSAGSYPSRAYKGSLETMPYKDVNAQLDYTLDHTGDLTFASTGFHVPIAYSNPPATELLTQLASSINSTLSSKTHAPDTKEYSVVLGIDFRNGREICNPFNASRTAFAARFDGCMCYLRARWDGNDVSPSNENNKQIRSFVKDIGKNMRHKVHEWAEKSGRYIGVPAYPGFCNQNDLNVKEMFGVENYERLKGLKEKYDPDNVFNGGFWEGTGGRGN